MRVSPAPGQMSISSCWWDSARFPSSFQYVVSCDETLEAHGLDLNAGYSLREPREIDLLNLEYDVSR